MAAEDGELLEQTSLCRVTSAERRLRVNGEEGEALAAATTSPKLKQLSPQDHNRHTRGAVKCMIRRRQSAIRPYIITSHRGET